MEGLRVPGERRTDPDTLSDINTRLALVESDLQRIAKNRWWLQGLAAVLIIQLSGAIYGYGRLVQRIDDIDLDKIQESMLSMEKNVDAALIVLADHGTELQDVRNEQARVRGNIDQLHEHMENLRRKLDDQTRERFYREDGTRLEERINRLENKILN